MASSDPPDQPAAPRGRPLTSEEFIVLNDEIQALLRAGIPLDLGLSGTSSRTSGRLSALSRRMSDQLRQGVPLEQVLEREKPHLPPEYELLVSTALQPGRIERVLGALSDLTRSTSELNRQLRLSLIYPSIILVLAFGLFIAYVVYIVPQVQRTYLLFGVQKSAAVTTLLRLHETAAYWGIGLPAGVVAAVLLARMTSALSSRRRGVPIHRWMPGSRDASLARFARMLGILVEHDLPLSQGLLLSGQAANDSRVERSARQLAAAIERGQSLPDAIQSADRLPSFLSWLISLGARQNSLPASLHQAANLYEQRALAKLDWFRRIVPPSIVLLVGGTITLFYGLTLFLPLSEMIHRLALP